MTDLPPPSPPGDPGSFAPPGGQPPPPQGWSTGPAPRKRNPAPLIILALALLAGAGVGLYFITKDKGKTTRVNVTLPASVPGATIPEVTLPEVTIPEVTIPEVTLPEVTLPEVTVPEITVPPVTTPTTEAGAQALADLTIAEQWFYPDSPGSNDYDWGVILNNAGTSAYDFVQVQADFFDDQGRLVGTETQFFSSVIPGKNITTSFFGSAPAAPTRMDAKVVIDDFLTEASSAPSGTLNFDQLAVANETDFSFDVTGQITSTFTDTLENVTVFGLWRDANGAVIYTGQTYIDHIPVDTPVLFSLNVFTETLPHSPPAELYFSLV